MTAVSLGNNSLIETAVNHAKEHAYEAILSELEEQGVDSSSEDFDINIVSLADAIVVRLVENGITIPLNISDPFA